ncbi:MAG: pyridoxine 5'-phosphate synthase [Candidatus Caenarcaniphilales bacterium]|nr:pyridoxine 5'-phosphate synthase [Candidatus Caenarcaniphilales bacterium]
MKQTPLLCINIDHVATLREARKVGYPSLIEAAILAEKAGAAGITVHLREDRRHIQDYDVFDLKTVVKGRYTLEMAVSEQILEIAKKVKPDLLTIVPEKRQELTTEGGLDVMSAKSKIKEFLQEVHSVSLEASLFVDPDLKTIEVAKEIGASRIELHTGTYANCKVGSEEAEIELNKLIKAAEFAHSLGFVVNAGHGLTVENIKPILKLPHLCELHIGHSIIASAVLIGLENAVREMKEAINIHE